MKKKIVIIVVLLVIALALLLIPKSAYQKIFNRGNNPDDNVMNYSLLVYLEDSKNRVVGVNVNVPQLEDDEIIQKWNLLTINQEALPESFKSSIPSDCELESYEIQDTTLIMYTNEEIYNANGRRALETIAWTFIDDEIDDVCIYVKDTLVSNFGDFNFKMINKKQGINLSYETLYLYESNATTMIYQEDQLIVPVTYFHLQEDICDYIVMKTLENVDLGEEIYDYSIEDSVLTLDFVDASVLTLNQITTLVESIGFNMNVNSLNINNNESVFYQRVFNEIEE